MIGATLGVAVLGLMFAGHAPDGAASLTGFRLAYAVGGAVELAGALLAFTYVRDIRR